MRKTLAICFIGILLLFAIAVGCTEKAGEAYKKAALKMPKDAALTPAESSALVSLKTEMTAKKESLLALTVPAEKKEKSESLKKELDALIVKSASISSKGEFDALKGDYQTFLNNDASFKKELVGKEALSGKAE